MWGIPGAAPTARASGAGGLEDLHLHWCGLSPLLILTLRGPERVLVVRTEPLDDLSCLTTPGSAVPEKGYSAYIAPPPHPRSPQLDLATRIPLPPPWHTIGVGAKTKPPFGPWQLDLGTGMPLPNCCAIGFGM